MATKTFYLKDAVPSGATLHRSLQDGGTAPTAATTGTGWVSGTNAAGQSCLMVGGTEVARNAATWGTTLQPSAAPSTTLGDCFRSENALTCDFANSNWVMTFLMRSVTAAYTGRFRLAIRIWKSANANGSSATELTSGRVVSGTTSANMTTTTDTTLTCTWSPGATKSLNNEYLFVNVGIEVTTAGGGNTQDMDFRVGSGSTLVTPNQVFNDSCAEGTVGTCTDTPSSIATFWPATAEGSATALDAPSNIATLRPATTEGTATALDTSSASVPPIFYASIGEGRRNFLTYTESFDNAAWAKDEATVTANAATGPFGGATADKLIPSTSPTGHNIYQMPVTVAVANGVEWASVYAKAAGYDWLMLNLYDREGNPYCGYFGLVSTGTLGYTDTSTFIESLGSGWYRCSLKSPFNDPSGVFPDWAGRVEIWPSVGDEGAFFAGNGTSGVYIWGAQREPNLISDYEPVLTVRTDQDTPNATEVNAAFIAEGTATALDALTNTAILRPALAEGSASATDTQSCTVVADVLAAEGPRNLLQYTEGFDNAIWVKSAASVTANAATDPFAGSTADKLIPSTGSSSHYVQQLAAERVDDNKVYYASVYAKAAGYSWIALAETSKAGVVYGTFFDLVNGITTGAGDIEDVGNGWYRVGIGIYSESGGSTLDVRVYVATGSGTITFAGDGTSGVYLSGGQREIDFYTKYEAVPTVRTEQDAPNGAITATYNVGVPEGRRNLLVSTENYVAPSSVWSRSGSTITVDATTDPFGGSNADKLAVSSTVNQTHNVQQFAQEIYLNILPSTDYYCSVYGKAAEYSWLVLTFVDKNSVAKNAWFNLSTGTPGTGGGTMEDAGDGWWRCKLIANSNTGSSTVAGIFRVGVANADGVTTYSGTTGSGIYIFGSQRERHAFTAYEPILGLEFVGSVDTSDGSTVAVDRVGSVGWVRFFAPAATAGTSYSDAVAEGSATAADTPSAKGTFATVVAEGTATAADSPSALLTIAASVVEGTPTATDTPSAKATWPASVAEGAATAIDSLGVQATFVPLASEHASANIIAAPSELLNPIYFPGATVTQNVAASPPGVYDADLLTQDTSNGPHGWGYSPSYTGDGTFWTFIVHVKPNGTTKFALRPDANAGGWGIHDTVAKTFSLVGGQATGTVVDIGGGWFELTVNSQPDPSGGRYPIIYLANAAGSSNFTGDGVSGAYLWKARLYKTDTDTQSTTAVLGGAVAEGASSAIDSPNTGAAVWSGTVTEGTATATDSVAASAILRPSVVEGTATALDTPSTTLVAPASCVEGTPTATDTPSARATWAANVAEGTPTATDTPAATFISAAVVAEGTATALDTPAAALNTAASVGEGTPTAADAPSAKATWATSVAEGSASAVDIPSTNGSIWRPAVAEGGATALDTPQAQAVFTATAAEGTATAADAPSVRTNFVVNHAEGAATAADTPQTTNVTGASCAEGSPTATDNPLADLNQSLSASVAEGGVTAVDTPSSKATYPCAVAEGAATANDVPSAQTQSVGIVSEGTATAQDATNGIEIDNAAIVEGTATALDTPSATQQSVSTSAVAEGTPTATDTCTTSVVTQGSIFEGTASAADTAAALGIWQKFIAEGSPLAQDTPSSSYSTGASCIEGGATAIDVSNAGRDFAVAVVEGASTALDTQNATPLRLGEALEGGATALDFPGCWVVTFGSVAEGTATAFDLCVIGSALAIAYCFEQGNGQDYPSAELHDRFGERDPSYAPDERGNVYVLPERTPIEVAEARASVYATDSRTAKFDEPPRQSEFAPDGTPVPRFEEKRVYVAKP